MKKKTTRCIQIFLLVVLFKMPFKYLQGFVKQQEKIVVLYYTDIQTLDYFILLILKVKQI
jgi:hypothetical protein